VPTATESAKDSILNPEQAGELYSEFHDPPDFFDRRNDVFQSTKANRKGFSMGKKKFRPPKVKSPMALGSTGPHSAQL